MSDSKEISVFRPSEKLVELFMPVFTPTLARQRYQVIKDLIDILRPDHDFGIIPGTAKQTLLKPGAEKLCTLFGLVPRYSHEALIENWGEDGSEPLFAYRIKCQLWRSDNLAGEGLGYASSRESKHRYRWVDEDTAKQLGLDTSKLISRDGRKREFQFDFAIDKAETAGQYGKPDEYWRMFREAIASGRAKRVQKETRGGKKDGWEVEIGQVQYRIPNPDIADVINTVLKMATKRALVAAVLVTVNVSDRFTQDVEDFIDVDYEDISPAYPNSPVDGTRPPAGERPAAGERYNAAQKEVLKRKLAENPIDVQAQPAEHNKPWRTRGEMLAKFHEILSHFSALNIASVYDSILNKYDVSNPEQFSDPHKALDCYRAMEAEIKPREAA